MRLSDRSVGWLRYLHRKANTEDNWNEFGHPHPHWDGRDGDDAPTAAGLRMDLLYSSFAMGLMAHTTPAWTEPYGSVLDQLVERHTGWWAVHDAGATLASDPDVSMLLLLGIRSMFHTSAGGTAVTSENEHADIAARVAARLSEAAVDSEQASLVGLAAAGLGLKLCDSRHGGALHESAFLPAWEAAVEHAGEVGGVSSISAAFFVASQRPAHARQLFDAARVSVGLDAELGRPIPARSSFISALILAREWGLTDLEQRLVVAIESSYGPTWNGGEFTWRMGLDEPHPHGRFNALLAAAEAGGPGAWERLTAAPLESCPQVVDVDVANMALDQAQWIDGNLHLGLAPTVEDPARSTSFRVVGAEPRMWDVHGIQNARIESRMSGLHVRVPMVRADMTLIRSSY